MKNYYFLLLLQSLSFINAVIEIKNTTDSRLIATVQLADDSHQEFTIEKDEEKALPVTKVKSITIKTEKKYIVGFEDEGGKGWSATWISDNLNTTLNFSSKLDRCSYYFKKGSSYNGHVYACKTAKEIYDSQTNPIKLVIVESLLTPFVSINNKGKTNVIGSDKNQILILWKKDLPKKISSMISKLKKD